MLLYKRLSILKLLLDLVEDRSVALKLFKKELVIIQLAQIKLQKCSNEFLKD